MCLWSSCNKEWSIITIGYAFPCPSALLLHTNTAEGLPPLFVWSVSEHVRHMSMCLCLHLGVSVYVSETMASLHARWLAGLSVSLSSRLSAHPAALASAVPRVLNKSFPVEPHSIDSINPPISHSELASRFFVHSDWEVLQFVTFRYLILGNPHNDIWLGQKCTHVFLEKKMWCL